MQAYFWTKTAHLVFVMAWMASVFYLPRILVNLTEAGDEPAVRARLLLMGRRLYRFGHIMFGFAVILGLLLWQGWRLFPERLPLMFSPGPWLHAKLALVALLLAYYIVSGRWLKGVEADRALPGSRTLRWFNELPVVLLVAIVYLVLAKPVFQPTPTVATEQAEPSTESVSARSVTVPACPPVGQTRLEEVLSIATKVAVDKGIDLERYDLGNARYECYENRPEWFVGYICKGNARPGCDFLVVVGDQDKSARYIPGM